MERIKEYQISHILCDCNFNITDLKLLLKEYSNDLLEAELNKVQEINIQIESGYFNTFKNPFEFKCASIFNNIYSMILIFLNDSKYSGIEKVLEKDSIIKNNELYEVSKIFGIIHFNLRMRARSIARLYIMIAENLRSFEQGRLLPIVKYVIYFLLFNDPKGSIDALRYFNKKCIMDELNKYDIIKKYNDGNYKDMEIKRLIEILYVSIDNEIQFSNELIMKVINEEIKDYCSVLAIYINKNILDSELFNIYPTKFLRVYSDYNTETDNK